MFHSGAFCGKGGVAGFFIRELIVMVKTLQYQREAKTAMLGGREIRLEHLTPVLSLEERAKRKSEIEERLFNIFIKYAQLKTM